MAQDGYPQGYPPQDPYAEQSPSQPGFGAPATSPPPPAGHVEHDGGKKKKRGYAAQAYDFGAGANSALGGQTQGGGPAFQPPPGPAYGGYQAQPEVAPYGAQQYGAPVGGPDPAAAGPGYASPAPYGGGVGYQNPAAGYPGPGAPQAPGIAGITQGMGQMGMGGQPPLPGAQPGQPQPPAGAARPAVLNQLYPTDLLNQPFNVAELDLPPPPIILPPNVRCSGSYQVLC